MTYSIGTTLSCCYVFVPDSIFSPDYSSSPSSLHVCFLSHRNHCHLRPTDTSVVFCPVIWHIFDVESKKKKTKWETARERGNNLCSPLQWKALFVEHSCVNPQYCHHHHHPPFPPLLLPCLLLSSLLSKAWVDFSLNAIRKVTGPIHGQMEGWLSVWRPIPSVENDRNPSCRWRSVWTEQTDFIGADRGENKWKEDCITYLLFISSSHCYFLCEQEPPFPILNSFNIFLWTQVFLHPFSTLTFSFVCSEKNCLVQPFAVVEDSLVFSLAVLWLLQVRPPCPCLKKKSYLKS